jgi:hypothetical protein
MPGTADWLRENNLLAKRFLLSLFNRKKWRVASVVLMLMLLVMRIWWIVS